MIFLLGGREQSINTPERMELARRADNIVQSVIRNQASVIAAFSDGSFSRNDMVRGSDVDIVFVVENGPGKHKVCRQIFDGVVFEWAFVAKRELENPDSILADAGLTHDLVSAHIWHDPTNFISGLCQIIRQNYLQPESVKARAKNQLVRVERAFNGFRDAVDGQELFRAVHSLSPIMRHAFAVPTALLNKPVSNCRAYLYSKRDSQELGYFDYAERVLGILGARGFTSAKAKHLLALLVYVFDSVGLSTDEATTYKAHLEIADYMIEIGEPDGAVWPIFFWAFGAFYEVESDYPAEVSERLKSSLVSIRKKLKLLHPQEIKGRVRTITEVIDLARSMINE